MLEPYIATQCGTTSIVFICPFSTYKWKWMTTSFVNGKRYAQRQCDGRSVLNHDHHSSRAEPFGSILKLLCKFRFGTGCHHHHHHCHSVRVVESKRRIIIIIMFNAFGSIVRAPLETVKKNPNQKKKEKKIYETLTLCAIFTSSHLHLSIRREIAFGIPHKAFGTFEKQQQQSVSINFAPELLK